MRTRPPSRHHSLTAQGTAFSCGPTSAQAEQAADTTRRMWATKPPGRLDIRTKHYANFQFHLWRNTIVLFPHIALKALWTHGLDCRLSPGSMTTSASDCWPAAINRAVARRFVQATPVQTHLRLKRRTTLRDVNACFTVHFQAKVAGTLWKNRFRRPGLLANTGSWFAKRHLSRKPE